MLERVTNSRMFLSFVLAGVTGLVLFFTYPFPQGNLYLQFIALKETSDTKQQESLWFVQRLSYVLKPERAPQGI